MVVRLDIVSLIKQIVGKQLFCVVCEVTAIDEEKRTCDLLPLNGDAELLSVNIQAQQGNDYGFCLMPELGSQVIAALINDSRAIIIATTSLSRAELVIDSKSIAI